uniref:2'-5'-oligoadenylate synthetase 1 domain-containing protein n=1 Tax=Naja naja TaxID=35670 RepID=A0A8C6Y7F2_NAJNA
NQSGRSWRARKLSSSGKRRKSPGLPGSLQSSSPDSRGGRTADPRQGIPSVSRISSWRLDYFCSQHLQPQEEFLQQASRAVDRICDFLKTRCFQDAPQPGIKVLRGGSLGKGTSMKNGKTDLELLSKDTQTRNRIRRGSLRKIVRWFSECKENMSLELIFEKSKWSNPRVLQFKLRSKKTEDFIDFDVLPAYDLNFLLTGHYDGSMPNPQIYVDLIRTGKSGEFSPCFTELQKDFIKDQPTKLKSLICLVKHWYNEEKSFPPKYALELLTVYAWEQGSGKTVFNTAEGFRTVLWLIEHYKEIRIYWTEYYDFQNEIIKQYLQKQLCKTRPVILDPADPTANLGEAEGWDRLAEKARCYASMNCCQKRDGSVVEPWDVPTVGSKRLTFVNCLERGVKHHEAVCKSKRCC